MLKESFHDGIVLGPEDRTGDIDQTPAGPYRPGSGFQNLNLGGLKRLVAFGRKAPRRLRPATPCAAAAAGRIHQHPVKALRFDDRARFVAAVKLGVDFGIGGFGIGFSFQKFTEAFETERSNNEFGTLTLSWSF